MGGVVGVAGVVVVWASAGDTANIAGEATRQTQPQIQGKLVRYDDRPVSAPNFHHFHAPGLLPSKHDT